MDVDVGPLTSQATKTRVENLVNTGVEQGANLLLDGRNPSLATENKDVIFNLIWLSVISITMRIVLYRLHTGLVSFDCRKEEVIDRERRVQH